MRKIWQAVWLWGSLCVAVAAAAEEAPPEAGVVIPDMDIAANLRRMLEAARAEQAGVESAADRLPAAPAHAVPAVPPPVVATPPVQPAPAPAAPPAQTSDYVPLPEREFTIRSVDDIRELARELEEAKQRQRR